MAVSPPIIIPAHLSHLLRTQTISDQPSSILLGDHMGSIHAVKMEYDLPDWEMGEADRPPAGISSPPRYRRWLWQEINLGKRVCFRRPPSGSLVVLLIAIVRLCR